jgi:hypothetical protein
MNRRIAVAVVSVVAVAGAAGVWQVNRGEDLGNLDDFCGIYNGLHSRWASDANIKVLLADLVAVVPERLRQDARILSQDPSLPGLTYRDLEKSSYKIDDFATEHCRGGVPR